MPLPNVLMPETFLILLAGGVMLAAAVSDPYQVTLHWLRLAGIIALAIAGLSMFFLIRHPGEAPTVPLVGTIFSVAAILAQLAFVQLAFRRTQQVLAWVAFFYAIYVGQTYLRPGNWQQLNLWRGFLVPYASSVGIASMSGLALMDMLLGHAYLTASKMTIHPFRRLNTILGGAILWRAIFAVGGVLLTNALAPIYMLWGYQGLFILTRWLIGLVIPAVFVYMAHDCIRRRSTQSATGILYVAGVLIFIGEIVATYLVRATGLPF